jgi:hypothetical protein
MSNLARALPAAPEGRDDDVFPLRDRHRLRDNLGLVLRDLREREPFASLARGPWSLFVAIATYWQGNAEAWPGQDTLARFTGWSSRAVRDQTDVLVQAGSLVLRRVRRADGSERLYYAPGLATLSALAAFAERFPRGRAKSLGPAPSAGRVLPAGDPPEHVAVAPPEAAAGELKSLNQIEPSSCERQEPKPPIAPTEEQQSSASLEDREIARMVLLERFERKHPERPVPRCVDANDLALVAAAAHALGGAPDTKLEALRDALAGAFASSKDRHPTVRFIWGHLEHLLDHADRGRKARLASERAARPAVTERVATPPERSDRVGHAQMVADLDRLGLV